MRTVLRYVDGRAIWSENVPAYPGSSKLGGSLVVGHSVPRDRSAQKAKRPLHVHEERPVGRPRLSPDVKLIGRGKRPGYPTEEERIAARRKSWRESQQRKRRMASDAA